MLKREDERLRKELNDKLQNQLEQVLAKKEAEVEEIERHILENEKMEAAKVHTRYCQNFVPIFKVVFSHFNLGNCRERSRFTSYGAGEEGPR